ncbi:MAG: FeoB-associated Cys-rich membrane protein [Clostridia bacterium]|nr:FeoB-associated Cys-rich membrane protein [Clostridia bacterium]
MNGWDWIILALVAAAVIAGIRRMRKKGGSCGGSCVGCDQWAQCPSRQRGSGESST